MAKGPRFPRPPAEGLRLFRLFGVPLVIHPSWLISLAVLSAFTYPTVARPALPGAGQPTLWLVSALAVLPIAACVVFHELAHVLTARAHGLKADGITLFALGGVSEIHGLSRTPAIEFQIAFAGPALSLVLATILAALARTLDPAATGLTGPLGAYAWVNLALAVFNLVPAFPLDGGRVLRALLWRLLGTRVRATRWAARVARGFAVAIISLGVFVLLEPLGRGASPQPSGVWTMVIGSFLFSAASAAEVAESGEDDQPR